MQIFPRSIMFEQTDIDRVRELTDLAALIGEHIVLTPKGREHVGLCPFHDDSNPSFAVVTHKGNHFYKCHSCGASGDCFRFVQEHLQKNFAEAVEFLADRVGMQIEQTGRSDPAARNTADRKTWLRKAAKAACDFFCKSLEEDAGKQARDTIKQRGIAPEMVERFELGAAPAGWDSLRNALLGPELPEKVLVASGLLKKRNEGDGSYDTFRNRLIFPIHDETGNPIAFGARALSDDDQPKYLNSQEHDLFHKGRTLYGLHLARASIVKSRVAIVTEGYTDVIACHGAGIENVVGTLGTAMTDEHVRKLARLCDRIVLVFDGDEAGRNAAERAVRNVFRHPVDVGICVLEQGQDPDDMLRTSDGKQRFYQAVEASRDAIEYLLERFQERLDDTKGLSARQRTLEQFIETLRGLGLNEVDGLRRSMLVNRIAEVMAVAPRDVDALLRRTPAKAASQPVAENEQRTTGARQIAERDLLAVLLFRPESLKETGLASAAVLSADRFFDPAHQALANTMEDLLQANLPTMQAVLGRLDDESHRELASRLYFIGERLAKDSDETTTEHPLLRAIAALDDRVQEEVLRQELSDWRNRDDTDERTPADVIKDLGTRKRRASAILRSTGND
ncbi:MAG: DNA primase [Phycisphaerales bacterium]|nr:DNA primase [Phycisphaerales bacterium]